MIVAHGAVMAQQGAEDGPLAREQQGADGVEERHRPAGGILKAEDVHGGHDDKGHQQVQRRHPARLHMEADGAEGGIQPRHGKHDEREHRRAQPQPHIVAQGHGPVAAEQAEAQPVGC